MTRLWISVALGVCLCAAAVAEGPTAELEWQRVEAKTALELGERRVAESHLRAALREAWYLSGLLAADAGDLAAAEEALTRARNVAAVQTEPSRKALAWVQLLRGQIDEPLKDLRLLAHGDQGDVEALALFVKALKHGGKNDELAVELEQLRTLAPDVADEVGVSEELPALDTGKLGTLSPEQRLELSERLSQQTADIPAQLEDILKPTDLEASTAGIRALDPDPVDLLAEFSAPLRPALELMDARRFDDALSLLSQADDPGAAVLTALVAMAQGDAATAEHTLLGVIETDPDPLFARQALARLYWHSDRRDAAKEQMLQAAELGSMDRDLSLALADMELADGRRPAANRQLRSLDRRFESVEAQLRLAEVFSSFGNHKAALDFLERALERAPSSELVLARHAQKALDVGVPSTAARSVEPLARMHPETAQYQLLLGRVWIGLRKMGEASEALLRAVALDPELVQAFLPLGLALNHESRFEEAQHYLARYLEQDPDNLEASAALAEAQERLDQPELAERRAMGVLEQDPAHARGNLVLGMIRSGRGEFASAREVLEQAVRSDPLMAKAHYQLSFACARLGDRECARDHLERYKKALKGPEASVVQMQQAESATVLQKKPQTISEEPDS